MVQPSLDAFVDRLSARSVLTDEERGALRGLDFEVQHRQPNQDFIDAGTPVEHLHIVIRGMGARLEITDQGSRQLTALHFPGEAANPRALVQRESPAAHVALVHSTIGRVPIASLRNIAARRPAITEALWREAAVGAEILTQWLVNIGRRDSKTRLAHLICELALRLGAVPVGEETVFGLPLTQEHLADVTGLTSVHVNRVLRTLREERLLALYDREAHILDWAGLVKAGEFRPDYLDLPPMSQNRLRMVDTV